MSLYDTALAIATRAHAGQLRKVDQSPYIAHPTAVAAMLREAGCSEVVVAAALVHDVLEDTGFGEEPLREGLGDEVVAIVKGVSEDKLQPWEERKRHYVEMVRTGPPEAQLVSLADKIHNLRGILEGHKALGEGVWSKFTRGKQETLWYYGEMLKVFEDKLPHPLVAEYRQLVGQLRTLV